MPHLLSACDLVRVADFTNSSVTDVAKLYFATGQRFGFEWLRQLARSHATLTTWEKEATNALIEELFDTQKNLTLSILDSERCDGEPDAAINRWAAAHTPALLRHERLSDEVRSSEVRGLAMLTVANHSLKALLDG
jgi:glutamate dehydrogenase